MKICVLTSTFNEEKILPFFLDYYMNYVCVDKIIIIDGGSTDNTLKILNDCPIVELIIELSPLSVESDITRNRNEYWKKYRDEYDWIIVADCDEFLYHSNLREKLIEYKNKNITIPLIRGYEMFSKSYPEFKKGNYLTNIIRNGFHKNEKSEDKNMIFNPKKIIDMNYALGAHSCNPSGDVVYSDTSELKRLHYKNLSFEYFTSKYKDFSKRISDENLISGSANHVFYFSKMPKFEFYSQYSQSVNIDNETPLSNSQEDVQTLLIDSDVENYNIITCVKDDIEYAKIINNFGGNLYVVDNLEKLEKFRNTLIENKLDLENIHFINQDFIDFVKNFMFRIDLIYNSHIDIQNIFQFLDVLLKQNNLVGHTTISITNPNLSILFKELGYKTNSNLVFSKNIKESKEEEVYVFSHNVLEKEWFKIIDRQLFLLLKSELYKISTKIFYFYYSSDENQIEIFKNLILKYDSWNKIIINQLVTDKQTETLRVLQAFCRTSPDSKILYFHNKDYNLTEVPFNVKIWNCGMEEYLIENWRDRLLALKRFDVQFSYFIIDDDINAFSAIPIGNFWWINAHCINRIEKDAMIYEIPDLFLTDSIMTWSAIGSINTKKFREIYEKFELDFDIQNILNKIRLYGL